jgi:hypothetical protein
VSADVQTETVGSEPTVQAQPPALREESELDELARLGSWRALAEQRNPDAKAQGAAGALAFYFARELGLPPLAALELAVVRGRLVVSARLLRALAARQGLRVAVRERSDERCTVSLVVAATGEELGRSTFTVDDAKRAGLIREGSAWITHPSSMLFARASSRAIYDYAPDVALGLTTQEEVEREPVTDAQQRKIAVLIRELGEADPSCEWTGWARDVAGVRSRRDLTLGSASALIERLQAELDELRAAEPADVRTEPEQGVAEAEWHELADEDERMLDALAGVEPEEPPA